MGEPDYPRGRGLRLRGYDYATPGAYFITVCTDARRCLFGHVEDGQVRLSRIGEIVRACWEEIPAHFDGVETDSFVVMPNHVHGIIAICEPSREAGHAPAAGGRLRPRSVGSIVGAFKAAVSRRAREAGLVAAGSVWQRSFHEHVIRNDQDLGQVREYIVNNPLKWHVDRENPDTGRR